MKTGGGPISEGEARIEDAKCPRIEGEARTEGEAREKTGGGGGANYVFKLFHMVKNTKFWPKRGHGPSAPLNTPLEDIIKV